MIEQSSPLDAVYVLGSGSKQNDLEVAASIGSLRKFASGIRNIVIVGQFPRSYVGSKFSFIPMDDLSSSRPGNTTNKLRKVCTTPGISDYFVLMNDDFFLTRPFDLSKTPAYRMGTLGAHIEYRSENRNSYYDSLVATERALRKKGKPTLDFELHVPCVYNRIKLQRVMSENEFPHRHTPLIRSLYFNDNGVEGVRLADLKFEHPITITEIEQKIAGRDFFSVGDGGFQAHSELRRYLTEKYL